MSYRVLKIYDKPMCCSTGVCGPEIDPELARFAADLEWLGREGVQVERYNPAHDPNAFVREAAVRRALRERGSGCLPLTFWQDAEIASGSFPSRAALEALLPGSGPEAVSTDAAPREDSR